MDIKGALNKIKFKTTNQEYFDIRNLYWYNTNEEGCPKVSIAFKRGQGEGVQYIDYKTKKTVYPMRIWKFANCISCEYNDKTTAHKYVIRPLDIGKNAFDKNLLSDKGHYYFSVIAFYNEERLSYKETKREFCEGISPLNVNSTFLKESHSRGLFTFAPTIINKDDDSRYFTLLTNKGDDNKGIAFATLVLTNCINQVNNDIKVKYNEIQSELKNKREQKEKKIQMANDANDKLFR